VQTLPTRLGTLKKLLPGKPLIQVIACKRFAVLVFRGELNIDARPI